MSFEQKVDGLNELKQRALSMGGEDEIRRQHERGKLTARERVKLLFDPGSFHEFGILAHHTSQNPDLMARATPADGVICGFGRVANREAAVVAYDFTVLAGSMGTNGERKVARLREQVARREIPIVWLLDSAGARVHELAGSEFAGTGSLFREQVLLSGRVPQVTAVMGPTAAGTSYIAALADFTPMVKGIGTMALAGPALVRTAIGEEIDIDSLGGSTVHTAVSGVGHLECRDDVECVEAIRRFLGYLPSSWRLPLPKRPAGSVGRLSDDILSILPDTSRRAFDMRKLIRWLTADFFELQPEWAKNILIGFSSLGGFPIGIVANQPTVLGGAIDIDAADKATRFIRLCDSFGIPLLFLHDCPGFMVGSKMEHAGIIRHGAKMLYAVSRLTVPKISVVVRKSYGAGYYAMCGRGYAPDVLIAWPGAEISLMSPEGAASISHGEAATASTVDSYRERISAEKSAREVWVDDVIDPRETALVLFRHLETLVPRHDAERAALPSPKHGVSPV